MGYGADRQTDRGKGTLCGSLGLADHVRYDNRGRTGRDHQGYCCTGGDGGPGQGVLADDGTAGDRSAGRLGHGADRQTGRGKGTLCGSLGLADHVRDYDIGSPQIQTHRMPQDRQGVENINRSIPHGLTSCIQRCHVGSSPECYRVKRLVKAYGKLECQQGVEDVDDRVAVHIAGHDLREVNGNVDFSIFTGRDVSRSVLGPSIEGNAASGSGGDRGRGAGAPANGAGDGCGAAGSNQIAGDGHVIGGGEGGDRHGQAGGGRRQGKGADHGGGTVGEGDRHAGALAG